MKISATNFQSWPAFDIQVEGLTVIVGPSNLGKSAMFRALKGVCRNEIEAGHIRKGTDSAQVTLHLDGSTATATRTPKSTSYLIKPKDGEPEELGKLAGAIPDAMLSWGFQPLEVGSASLDPVFASQFDSPFLLRSTPAERNAIFGAFAATEKLDEGRKSIKAEITAMDAEAKALAGEIERKLTDYDALKTTLDSIAQANLTETIPQTVFSIRALQATDLTLASIIPTVCSLNTVRNILAHTVYPEPHLYLSQGKAVSCLGNLHKIGNRLQGIQAVVEAVKPVSSQALKGHQRLADQIHTLKVLISTNTKLRAACERREAIKAVEGVSRDAILQGNVLRNLNTLLTLRIPNINAEKIVTPDHLLFKHASLLLRMIKILTKLQGIQVPDTRKLEKVVGAAKTLQKSMETHKGILRGLDNLITHETKLSNHVQEVSKNHKQIKFVESEIQTTRQAIADTTITCPKCGTLINKDLP